MELTGKSETLPQKVPFPQRIPETNITF